MTIVASDVLTSSCDKPLVLHKYKEWRLDYNGNPINIMGKVQCQVHTPTGDLCAEILVYKRDPESSPWTPLLLIGMNILANSTIWLKDKKIQFSTTRVGRRPRGRTLS